MTVTTEIILSEKSNILVVPALAIQTSGTGTMAKKYVQTYNNKIVGKKDVETGITDGDLIEITA